MTSIKIEIENIILVNVYNAKVTDDLFFWKFAFTNKEIKVLLPIYAIFLIYNPPNNNRNNNL